MAILAPTINIEIAKQKQAKTGSPEALLCIFLPLMAMFSEIYNSILSEAYHQKHWDSKFEYRLKSPQIKSAISSDQLT